MTRVRLQNGFILMPVVIAIVLIATIAFMLNNQSTINVDETGDKLKSVQVENIAHAALAHATWGAQNSGCAGDMAMTAVPFGQASTGSYTATVTTPGGTTTAYPNLAVDQDAWFRSDNPTSNDGTNVDMHLRMESGKLEYALYRFDLSSLPAGSQINSATAWLYVATSGPGGGVFPEGQLTVHRVTSNWTETGATWDTMNTNYDSAVIATIPAQPVDGVWVQINLTAQVQAWVNGGEANYGIMLKPTAEGTHGKLASREATAGEQPRLDVIVGTGPATPLTINATGTLTGNPSPANDISRSLNRTALPSYQPVSNLVLQPGSEGKDGWVNASSPNDNFGVTGEMVISGGVNPKHFLTEFELPGIPLGSTILSAKLEMHLEYMSSADTAAEFSIYRMTQAWTEGTGDYWNPGDGANWSTADGSTAWSWSNNHDVSSPVATTRVNPTFDGWHSWEIKSLVQQWISGQQPNYGLLITGNASAVNAYFHSSDWSTADERPKLTITYACECGSPCLAPQGSGKVLMPVTSTSNPSPGEVLRIALIESWGYVVDTTWEKNSQSNFNSRIAANDVVYVPATVNPANIGTKLTNAAIGVVNENSALNDELGIATGSALPVGLAINVTDTSHYITALFPTGPLDIYAAAMEQLTVSGTEAPGLQTLADTGGAGSLVVLDGGADMAGGGTAAGRRVMLPLGTEAKLNWNYLNGNGRLIVQRALQWGTGTTAVPPAGNLLLVVVNPGSLIAQEAAKKTLIESWGYGVTVIDDSDSQANFDAAVSANDVVYISETVDPNIVGTKLTNASIGIVNEEMQLYADLDLGKGIAKVMMSQINIIDNAHSITSGFATGLTTIVTSPQIALYISAGLAAGAQTLAETDPGIKTSLFTVEAGAALATTGNFAAGRRVQLPWGFDSFDFNLLNADGRTIMQRAIKWAAGSGSAATGPLAHWKLDDAAGTTAVDSEGGHDGTLINSTPVWVAGQVDGALDFDGVDDYVDLTSDAELTDVFDGGATVMAWIFPRSWGESVNGRILDKSSQVSGDRDGWMIAVKGDSPSFQFAQGFTGTRGYWRSQTGSVALNEWVHVAVVYDASSVVNDAEIYLNGVKQSSLVEITPTGSIATDAGISLRMGNWAQDTSRTFDGIIDDVRIYDRMLSAIEVAELAVPPSTLPIAHWKLDDASGLTAVDSVGGHNGTLTSGGPVWTAGQVDGALHFDGSNDYINVPHDPTLNLASALTISTWFRADSFGTGIDGYRTFLGKYPSTTTANYWFGTWKQELVFGFWSGGVWQEVFPTGLGLSTGQWYQAAVTFDDASDQVLLYLDGTLVHTGVMTLTPPVNTGAVTIGRSAAGEYWDGQLDDIRIYDKVLTGADIAALAGGGGGGGSGPPPGDGVIFEEYTQASLASNGTSMSINKPGGTAAGDLLIATLVTDGEQKNAMTLSGGWTLIDHGVESKQVSMDVWWKLAGSSEPAQYAFGWAKSQEAYGWIMRFTGHDAGNPINDSENTGGSSAAPTSPSVNTTVANAMILRIGGFDDDDITVGDPGLTGHTAITMNRSDSGNGTTSGGAGYLIKAATGASGASTFALTASEDYRAVTIGIAPAP